jgi:hypothetical protein
VEGKLDAWIDFNQDGDWSDPGEQIFASESLAAGSNSQSFDVPVDAVLWNAFARFRFSTAGGLAATGPADDGEVEDYAVRIFMPSDFGDAPDPYPTLFEADGAYHTIVPGVYLGSGVDEDLNGVPDTDALGDDNAGDDEDGVTMDTPLVPGQATQVTVTASVEGKLDAWIDFNQDGDWSDPGEQIFASESLAAGSNSLSFDVPADAALGNAFARFRFSTAGGLTPGGPASDGEVEDYRIEVTALEDLGDAPDTGPATGSGNYNTLSTHDGPIHTIVPGLYMGGGVDGEPEAIPSVNANGDDTDQALPDDEDGLANPMFDLALTEGTAPTVNVTVTNTTASEATLFGWIDYNGDGALDNSTERASIPVLAGTTASVVTLAFPPVPEGAASATYARFRLSTDPAAADPTGLAGDGEVEDYPVSITKPGDRYVKTHQKINNYEGDLTGTLNATGRFGESVASLGDLNGDGVNDLAVGGSANEHSGVVWVLFQNADGMVVGHQRISADAGNFTGDLTESDSFGSSLANLGDLDGDGVVDLAVGAPETDRGSNRGAVWILFLNADGTVKTHQEISSTQGNFQGGTLGEYAKFGQSVASVGDLDGDGVTDLAVGAPGDLNGGVIGAAYILFLNADGTVKNHHEINARDPGLWPNEEYLFCFGAALANLGDLDGDGVTDLAVGNPPYWGYHWVFVLFLNADGTVKDHHMISEAEGGFRRSLASLANLGDLDADGVTDLGIGYWSTTRGGVVSVVFLNSDGTVKTYGHISATQGNFTGELTESDDFGSSIANLGDLDGDGVIDLAVGAQYDSVDDVNGYGAVWVLFLEEYSTLDFGDAPAPYPTTLAAGGAHHTVVSEVYLGNSVDREPDGREDLDALGDDNADLDDEDGVVMDELLKTGQTAQITVTASVAGKLDAWIDLNIDGDWDDQVDGQDEQIFVSESLAAGPNDLSFDVPAGATPGYTFVRFRFSTAGGLDYVGPADDGEVEDYRVGMSPKPVTFAQVPDLDLSAQEVWYFLQTTQPGTLRAEALFKGAPDSVSLLLHDDARNPLPAPVWGIGDGKRLDWPVDGAGEYYYLKVSGSNPQVDLHLANFGDQEGVIDFSDYVIGSYGNGQDHNGPNDSATVEDFGSTLHLKGNVWKKIDLQMNDLPYYIVTANTVLEFDFKSTSQGEIHGIGLDDDLSKSFYKTFELYGTQNWGHPNYKDYVPDGYKHYRIPIGQAYAGRMEHLFFINDHDVAGPTAESFFRNVRVIESPQLDFDPLYKINPYGGLQDVGGEVSVEDNGATLHLTGNVWKKIDLPYHVTANTVLEFDFNSTSQGEIHGIGLDDDLSKSFYKTFQLYGTQDWGHPNYEDYVPDGYKSYVIPIGEYYGDAQMEYLFFVNDHDVAGPTAESFFRNVRLREDSQIQLVNFYDINPYGGLQDVGGEVSVEDGGATLHLTGNVWKEIDVPYDVTANTVLEFDFKSTSQGEIHGIGLDDDLSKSFYKTFELYGTQNWGHPNYKDYVPDGYKHYQIPIGQYYSGRMEHLFFINDHDVAGPTAESFFRNVRLRENSQIDWVDYLIGSYGGSAEDVQGWGAIQDDGATLHMTGNMWKRIDLIYHVTANTVLEFDFKSTSQGEIHGIGLDDDLLPSIDKAFELYGTENWGHPNYKDYVPDGYKHYQIPIGEYYSGWMNHLFFVNDDDSAAAAESFFRNVSLWEMKPR